MKSIVARVVSNKMKNTIVVEVIRQKIHPLYKKIMRRSKKFKVDTGSQNVKVGDNVEIVECRPISKEKHYKLLRSLK